MRHRMNEMQVVKELNRLPESCEIDPSSTLFVLGEAEHCMRIRRMGGKYTGSPVADAIMSRYTAAALRTIGDEFLVPSMKCMDEVELTLFRLIRRTSITYEEATHIVSHVDTLLERVHGALPYLSHKLRSVDIEALGRELAASTRGLNGMQPLVDALCDHDDSLPPSECELGWYEWSRPLIRADGIHLCE